MRKPKPALDTQELLIAQTCIYGKKPGKYETKDILGDHWDKVGPVFSYGLRFRVAVNRKMLHNIEYYSRNRSNHQVYSIHG